MSHVILNFACSKGDGLKKCITLTSGKGVNIRPHESKQQKTMLDFLQNRNNVCVNLLKNREMADK